MFIFIFVYMYTAYMYVSRTSLTTPTFDFPVALLSLRKSNIGQVASFVANRLTEVGDRQVFDWCLIGASMWPGFVTVVW